MFRTILVLGRVSNLPTVWTNVLAGWFIAGGEWKLELAWVLIGVSLLYVAGMTLNDAFDSKWDRAHAPERPIPSGAISQGAVWILGCGQLAAGIGLLLTLTAVHPIWVAALTGAILLYDWIHKKTPWSVLVMGSCRALVYVLAASAVLLVKDPLLVWVAAAAMGTYVVGITLAARSERVGDKKEFGHLVRLCLLAPVVILALAPSQMDERWPRVTIFFLSLLIVILWMTISERTLKSNTGLGVAFSLAGITLIDAAAVSYANWEAGLFCVACFPLTLLSQQKVPAT